MSNSHNCKYSVNAPRSPDSELSFSIRNSPDYRTTRNNKRGVYTSPKRAARLDALNIENIDHIAIQNDSELRNLSRNKAAFNGEHQYTQHNNIYSEEEELTYDSEGEENFIKNDVQRILSDYDRYSQERHSTPSLSHSFSVPAAPEVEPSLSLQLKQLVKTISEIIFRSTAFLFFMVYWIIKEPIIRTVTFFTMVVSTVIVEPILFGWSSLPHNRNWMPSQQLRKRLTQSCTLIVFLLLCVPMYNQLEPYLPNTLHDYFPLNFTMEQSNSNTLLQLQQELGKTQQKLANYESLLEKNKFIISKQQELLDENHYHLSQHTDLLQKHEKTLDNMNQLIQREAISYIDQLIKEGLIVTRDGSDSSFTNLISSALSKYHQDVLNKADYALESRGASVITRLTSPTWFRYPAWIQAVHRFAGLPLTTNHPENALSPQTHVGECWFIHGNSGNLGIKLSEPIQVKGIVVEYPSQETVGDMSTAPKDIQVFGIRDFYKKDESFILLGEISYDINKKQPIQQFDISPSLGYFKAVFIKVLNNWGNEEHTDIYRIRVHGDTEN